MGLRDRTEREARGGEGLGVLLGRVVRSRVLLSRILLSRILLSRIIHSRIIRSRIPYSRIIRSRILYSRIVIAALALVIGCADRPRSTAPASECDEVEPTDEDAAATCGLAEVHFAAGSDALDTRAECQLVAAASCIAGVGPEKLWILEAHASVDEVRSEEEAILLTDRRGLRVRARLLQHGADRVRMQVISRGTLDATTPGGASDRRVRFILGDILVPPRDPDPQFPVGSERAPRNRAL